ncbi:site-specific recombinase XerD [Georgenia muralis]|uniref:Site-specific recombinase XerD n=2 Tax=Georgenia muralis TaxID=154117 RepID=A0A3N4Z2F9_9MICO|nr:site-specific recombinase XerD [Georgenia muralis]
MSGTRRKPGQLGPHVEGYRSWLAQRGYTPGTIRNMLKDLGRVGRWLSGEGQVAGQLNEERMEAFRASLGAAGRRRVPGTRALAPLLGYLREVGVAPAAQPSPTALGELLRCYRSWMVQERGLAPTTVLRYENTARRFLQEQATGDGVFAPSALTGEDVNAFLLRECARVSSGAAKGRVAELRSVLRFLYLQEITPLGLGSAVPGVGGWRLATLPPTVSAADVQLLLDSCDRNTSVGLRDFAMMTVVARLGLRSIEVARLELRDVEWRAGELLVRGKGRRQDRLPLLADVGEAFADYLSAGRNPAGARHVFLTCRAPRGPIRADLVGDVVERACKRAGQPVVGPHRLRHALAGDLLRHGGVFPKKWTRGITPRVR